MLNNYRFLVSVNRLYDVKYEGNIRELYIYAFISMYVFVCVSVFRLETPVIKYTEAHKKNSTTNKQGANFLVLSGRTHRPTKYGLQFTGQV